MCSEGAQKALRALEQAAVEMVRMLPRFSDQTDEERGVCNLCNAIVTRGRILADFWQGKGNEATDKNMQMSNLLLKLADYAQRGVLSEVLSDGNKEEVRKAFGSMASVGEDLIAQSLRRKDTGNYLLDAADTDLFLGQREELARVMEKKKR